MEMENIQVELEDVSSVKKKLKIEVPADVAGDEFERIAKDFKKYARLPGFRPGKAPLDLIKKRFVKDIRGEVLQKLVPESWKEAVKQKGVRPLGGPEVDKLEYETGQALTYEALFEVPPEIRLATYHKLEIKADERVVTDDDVQAELERIREEKAPLVAVEDRPAREGDYAMIDLKGKYLGGEEADGEPEVSEEDVLIHVGDERTHQAFTDAITGLNIGEEASFRVSYEEGYPEARLAGKTVAFTVEVTDIKKKKLPDLDDEFVKDLEELDLETLDQLRTYIKDRLVERRDAERENEIRKLVLDRLIEANAFEVPLTLVEDQIDDKVKSVVQEVASQGVDPGKANVDWRKVREGFREEGEREVRAALILDEIAQKEEIEVSRDDLNREFERMAESLDQPVEKVRQHFLQDERLLQLKAQMRRTKALDLVRESADIQVD